MRKTDGLMHFYVLDAGDPACCLASRDWRAGRINWREYIQRTATYITGLPSRGGITTDRELVTCPECRATADFQGGAPNVFHGVYTVRYFGWPIGEKVSVPYVPIGSRREGMVVTVQQRTGDDVSWQVDGADGQWSSPYRPSDVQLQAVQISLF